MAYNKKEWFSGETITASNLNRIEDGIDTLDKLIVTYIPDPPTTDGAYTLKCVVTNGTPTYSWASN